MRTKVSEAAERTAFLQDEVDASWLYGQLAALEQDPHLAEVYRRLSATEATHAERWGEAGAAPQPSWRARTLAALARRFGPDLVLGTLVAQERASARAYTEQGGSATGMAKQESSHARLLGAMAGVGGMAGSAVARLEGRHRAARGNALRAAVLGANDGLVSNLSLVSGVAGAALSPGAILVTGLAGLLAGAGSMAMGEWLSVQSSRELYEHQIAIEAQEIAATPEEEAEELALIYQAKGFAADEARALAERIVNSPATAVETLAREELGVDPEELGGSAWEAAGTSFVLFALGAIVPVAPYLFLSGPRALVASVLVSAVALFALGAGITLLTGRGVLRTGARQLAIGVGAAALTYVLGLLLAAAGLGASL